MDHRMSPWQRRIVEEFGPEPSEDARMPELYDDEYSYEFASGFVCGILVGVAAALAVVAMAVWVY
jgi:hypothetical protein